MTEPHLHLAVLGSPISHSRSPRIHAAAYEALGLPWRYEAVECREDALEALLDSLDASWRGLSVTMPLKAEAHRLSTVLDPIAEESGVVNTLLRVTGRGSKPAWAGFNTDVAGLAAAIEEAGLDATRTIVLGAGATAVSAVLAARSLGARSATILARRPEAARALAERFDGTSAHGTSAEGSAAPLLCAAAALGDPRAQSHVGGTASLDAIADATLVVSTLPGPAAHGLELPEELLRAPLFDVAYDPWPSPLAERWRAAGGVAHSGIAMLVHQALMQLRIFVNGDPSLPVEREAEAFAAMRAAGMGR